MLGASTFTFNFGDVTVSADNDASNDTIVVEVTALASNDARNQRGDNLVNTGRIDYVTTSETGVLTANFNTATASIRIVTPDLNLAKSVSPGLAQGGDVVTYTLLLTNPSGSNATTAFGIHASDTDLAALGFSGVTITSVGSTGAVGAAATASAGGVIDITADSLNAGGAITVKFTAAVSPTVLAGSVLTNFARITDYATLPGGDPLARVITNELPVSASLLIRGVTLTKTLITTSVGGDANPNVQIGETATFDLVVTLPEGTDPLIVTDLLPSGAATLNFVSATLISIGGNTAAGATAGGTLSGSAIGVGSAGVIGGGGLTATFNFGTIYNTPDGITGDGDRIVIRVTTLVPDVPENTAADDNVVNTAIADFGLGTSTATSALNIVEPRVTIAKSGPAGPVAAGTRLTYTLLLGNTGDGVAFDLALSDPLAANLTLVPGSVSYSGAASGTAADLSGVVIPVLRPGETVTVIYQADVGDGAVLGSSIVNTARVNFDSLPGSGGRQPAVPPQSSSVVAIGGPVTIDKTIFDTSVGHDTDPRVVIGETVTYRLVATLPDGTTTLQLTDILPSGLDYVAGSARLVSLFGSASAPVTIAGGATLTFDFGTIVNPSANPDNTVVVELTALVADVPGNQRGSVLTNAATVATTLGTVGDPTPPSLIVIVPELTIAKTALLNGGTSGDAGDIVTYTVTIGHTAASNAAARDLAVADLLPPGLTLFGTPVIGGSGSAGASLDPTAPANSIRVIDASLAVGETLTVTYTARIADSAVIPSSITNTAGLGYDSLPGPGGRPGSAAASSTITITGVQAFTKALIATSDPLTGSSQFDPAVTDLAIGETATFELLAVLPEGTIGPVTFTDSLLGPKGTLGFVPGTVTASIGGVAVPVLTTAIDTNGDGIADALTFSLGTIVIPGDNIAANNLVSVRYTALAVDLPVNFAAPGRVQVQPALLTTPLGALSAATQIEIVEPKLVLDKTASSVSATPGDTITYRLTLDHRGSSTAAAHDLQFSDDLSSGSLTLVPGSLHIVSGPGEVVADGTVNVHVDVLLLGEQTVVEYRAVVGAAVPPGSAIPNIARVGFDSQAGAGGRPGEATDTFTFGVPDLEKLITGTSLADTGDAQFRAGVTDLAIGEHLFYDLVITLPTVGTQVRVTDSLLGTSAAGLLTLVGTPVIVLGPGVTATIPVPVLVQTDTNGDGIADELFWDFGTVSYSGSGEGRITISVDAVVPDIPGGGSVPGNTAGDLLNLPANLDYAYGNVVAEIGADIVEPRLTLLKSVTPAIGEAGTLLGYTIRITNAGSGPAYDLALSDIADAGLLPVGLAVLHQGGTDSSFVSINAVTVARLLPGESITIDYGARVADSVLVGSTLRNTAATPYDTLPGSDPGQRSSGRSAATPRWCCCRRRLPNSPRSSPSPALRTPTPATPRFAAASPISASANLVATVELAAILPRGTETGVTITDTLAVPQGVLAFDPASVVVRLGGTLLDPAGYSVTQIDSNGDGVVDRLSFSFARIDDPRRGRSRRLSADHRLPRHRGRRARQPRRRDARPAGRPCLRHRHRPVTLGALAGVDLVEPRLTLLKSVTPPVAEAGSLLGYTIRITNAGSGPAYDLALSDIADAGLLPVGLAVLHQGGTDSSFVSINAVTVARLLPGESITIDYGARVADSVLVGSTLRNTAATPYDTLPGSDPGQRMLGPVSGDAAVVLLPTTPAELTKVIAVAGTSDPNTGDAAVRPGITDLGIGEVATVALAAILPRGTVTGVTITDTLAVPQGVLAFDPASVVVRLGGIVLDPASYSVTQIDSNGDGVVDRLSFAFGSLTIPGEVDPAAYPLTIAYRATAVDVPANRGDATLDLPAALTYTTATGTPLLGALAGVDLVAPALTLAKTAVKLAGDSGSLNGLLPPGGALAGTAGDIFGYTLTITHAAGSNGPAYDLALSDTLPPGLSIVAGSVATSLSGAVLSSGVHGLTLTAAALLPGESFTVTYQARIDDAVVYGTVLPNHAALGYDTQAGPGGRVGATAADAAVVLDGTATVVKTVIATTNPSTGSNAFDPSVTDLSIGEGVTFRSVSTFAEGTAPHVVITERLPSGPGGILTYVANGTPVLGSGITAERPNPAAVLTDTDGDGLPDTISFDFGRVTVAGDNVIDARDTISIDIDARLIDDPRNVSGRRLDSPVLLDFGTGSARAAVAIEVVEPLLILDKTALEPQRFPGEIATYTIRLYHAPNSTVAADIAVIDTLSPGLTLVPGSLIVLASPPGIPVTIDGTTIALPLLPLGSELLIQFKAVVGFDVDTTRPLVNTATASFDQIPGGGGRPGSTGDTAEIIVLAPALARRDDRLPDFYDDRYVEPLPAPDAIVSGSAQPGARITLDLGGSLRGSVATAAVTADTGGNWLALLPTVTADSRGADNHRDAWFARSRLFEAPAGLPPLLVDGDGHRGYHVTIGGAPGGLNALHLAQTAAPLVRADAAAANLRAYFAPAWRDQLFADQPLSVDTVFRDLAGVAVHRDFAADREPLGLGVNRFNAEFLAGAIAGNTR